MIGDPEVIVKNEGTGTWRLWVRSLAGCSPAGARIAKHEGHPPLQWTFEDEASAVKAAARWNAYIKAPPGRRKKS